MKKRVLSIALVLCMVLSLLPLTPIAVAATTTTTTTSTPEKDITLGTSAIQGSTEVTTGSGKYYTPNSYIYFGMNGTTPIKWRVLDADKANDGTTAGMFLLSEYVLATGVQFDTGYNNDYQGSNAQTWCKNFAANSSNFSTTEQNTMLGVAKTDSTENLYGISWGESSLTIADKAFFLSARELADYVGNYNGAPGLAVTDAAQASAWWWLRSPGAGSSSSAGVVDHDGVVDLIDVDSYDGVRPALNLNLSSVLFTSAAVGGKSSPIGGGVVGNKNYADITGNDGYKLTLLDESRSGFSAYLKSVSGNTATVSYSGAKTGTNEYISVIIRNGDTVKYYGRVASTYAASYASGEVNITLPDDYSTANGDVLCVFNEQYNGDKNTDYASDVVVLPDYRWFTTNTDADIYTISTVSELLGFANLVNGTNLPSDVTRTNFSGKTVKLANNLDLSCISNWTPIAKKDLGAFCGTFDGQGNTISNLTVYSTEDYEYVGLFAKINSGAVENLSVSGNVTAMGTQSIVGGIVGRLTNSKIENCSFSGNVTAKGEGNSVGGIVGECASDRPEIGVISKCRNAATISSENIRQKVGGIVGDNNGRIRYCYNQGNITLSANYVGAGGIAGQIMNNGSCRDEPLIIQSCYNVGSISAAETITNKSVGSLIGCLSLDTYISYLNGIYYLDGTGTEGIGAIDLSGMCEGLNGSAEGKISIAFENGEVAWLLQNAADDAHGQIWGQTIGTDTYPVFANESGSNTVYKVTFKVDGEADRVKYANKGGTVSIDAPTAPTGYHFGGWYTAATGGTKFDLSAGITVDTTLYARFALNTYTVSYNAGANGTGTIAAGSKTHGVNFTLSSDTFTRTGYTQTGWATTDGGEQVYDLGGSYTANSAVTLYPVWTVNQYTITVKPENGETDITITKDYGTTVTAPTLTRDGYAFDGWDKTFPTTMPAESVTITAKWKDITAPTGEIKLGANSWRSFLNHITFGLFFKDTQEITIPQPTTAARM